MTNIRSKLTASLTTIALLASATGAQAASSRTQRPTRHFAISQSERHFTLQHPRRSTTKFQRDSRGI